MDNKCDVRIVAFLNAVGIRAHIIDGGDRQKLIAIPTQHFDQHRAWVQRWFTLVEQRGDYCYFHVRLRGTGDTL